MATPALPAGVAVADHDPERTRGETAVAATKDVSATSPELRPTATDVVSTRAARRDNQELGSTLGLVAVTIGWGLSFIIIKDAVTGHSAANFLVWRFALATLALVVARPKAIARLSRRQAMRAAILGGVFGAAQLLQTVGLQRLPASVSAFITGLYVVLTPIFGAALFRRRVGRTVWVAVALATIGLAILSLRGFAISVGDLLTVAAAALYALHITGLGRWSTSRDAYAMATVQVVIITLVALCAAGPSGISLPSSLQQWWPIVYAGLVASAFALLVQTWAQSHLGPNRAAIILTGEPVFAAIFAVGVGGERLSWRLGGGLPVLAAMLLVEQRSSRELQVPHLGEGP